MNNIFQIGLAVVFALLLVLLADPFMYWMPEAGTMIVLLLAAILACVWMGFVAYERTEDERDALHRMHAGRIAYLSGVAVLTLALLVQGLGHAVDPWISLALGLMISVKIAARYYMGRYR
jgi:hypothetical protein